VNSTLCDFADNTIFSAATSFVLALLCVLCDLKGYSDVLRP